MEKKYELTDETINVRGVKLHRIRALRDFGNVNAGDKGGWIEKDSNLSHNGTAWVYGNAMVYDNAKVHDYAQVYDNAMVYGNAKVYDYTLVYGDAQVYDNALVYGDAKVHGNAKAYGDTLLNDDAWVYDNAMVYGDAQVYGNAKVHGDAKVYGDANIKNGNSHCGFDFFGSRNSHTHAYLTKEGKVEITCGCFRGSIEEFEEKVEETHAGTIHEKQYKAIINVIKIKFGIE